MGLVGSFFDFLRFRMPRPRRMVPISRRFSYDDAYLTPRIPPECRYLNSFETDEPFFRAENFLSGEECDALAERLLRTGSAGKLALRYAAEGANASRIKIKARNTDALVLYPEDLALYRRAFEKVKPDLERFFRVRLGESEGVQALGYSRGCRYRRHADSCNPRFNRLGFIKDWVCTLPNRVISTIFFLSDAANHPMTGPNQCVGGDVTFAYLRDDQNRPYRLRPRKGLFVAFPGTPYFSHEVHEVKDGYRVTLVEWYGAEIRA
jgi:hypothetical protein